MDDSRMNGQENDNERERNQERFETELEFIQCLANPFYLASLAEQGYFDQDSFINYLNYLTYWTKPTYARYLTYPQALHHLKLLNESKAFRESCKNQAIMQELAGKQLGHWAGWREEGGIAGPVASKSVESNGVAEEKKNGTVVTAGATKEK